MTYFFRHSERLRRESELATATSATGTATGAEKTSPESPPGVNAETGEKGVKEDLSDKPEDGEKE